MRPSLLEALGGLLLLVCWSEAANGELSGFRLETSSDVLIGLANAPSTVLACIETCPKVSRRLQYTMHC